MSAIRFFTDEDVQKGVAIELRRLGFDCVSTLEVVRLGESDESQLEWATRHGRAIVTFNVGHFAALNIAWLKQAKPHAGIVVSSQRPVGEVARRLTKLAATLDANAMLNRIEYLNYW